jgi:putative transposase
VLVTKYRHKCFTKDILSDLNFLCQNILEKWSCSLLEFGGEENHIHLLIEAHPAMNMSILINNLKTVSSRLIKKKYSGHFRKFYWKPALWTRAYCLLTTGGASIDVIKKYIENQGKEE